MSKSTERREQILAILSYRRKATIVGLAEELGSNRKTIQRDLAALNLSAPIYTIPGNGGGIRVADGWYLSRTYLSQGQEALLRKLSAGLQPEDLKTMQSILATFAKPKVKEDCYK